MTVKTATFLTTAFNINCAEKILICEVKSYYMYPFLLIFLYFLCLTSRLLSLQEINPCLFSRQEFNKYSLYYIIFIEPSFIHALLQRQKHRGSGLFVGTNALSSCIFQNLENKKFLFALRLAQEGVVINTLKFPFNTEKFGTAVSQERQTF